MTPITDSTIHIALKIAHKLIKIASLQEGGECYARLLSGLVHMKIQLDIRQSTQTASAGVYQQRLNELSFSAVSSHYDCDAVFVDFVCLRNISGGTGEIGISPELELFDVADGGGRCRVTLAHLISADEKALDEKIKLLEASAIVASTSMEKIDLDTKMKHAAMQAWCKSIEPEIMQIIQQTVSKNQYLENAARDYAKQWCFEQIVKPDWRPEPIKAEQMLGITQGFRKLITRSY